MIFNRVKSLRTSLSLQKKYILFALAALCIGWVVYTRFFGSTTTSQTTTQTVRAQKQTLVVSVSVSGQVLASRQRAVQTAVSGIVKKIHVIDGQIVRAGDTLYTIDLDQESLLAYTQALANYQSAVTARASAQSSMYSAKASMMGKWDTFYKLSQTSTYDGADAPARSLPEFHIANNEWLAAENTFKNQDSALKQAQLSLQSAQQALALASPIIRAPIAGTVGGIQLVAGSILAPATQSQTVASIHTQAPISLKVSLTETDVTKIQIGNKATITIDALAGKTYTASVYSVDTLGAQSSGVTSYSAVLVLDTKDENILPNMSIQANIIVKTLPDVIVVPTSAIKTASGISSATVLVDGKEQVRTLTIGQTVGTNTQVVSGIQEGEIVLLTKKSTTSTSTTSQSTSPFSGLGIPGAGVRRN